MQVFVVQPWWLRHSQVVISLLQSIQVRLNVVILDHLLCVSPTPGRQLCGAPGSHWLWDCLQQSHQDYKDWAVERAIRRNNSWREGVLRHLVWTASPMQLLYPVFLILIFHSPTETNKQHNLNSSKKQGTSIHGQILLMVIRVYPNHM